MCKYILLHNVIKFHPNLYETNSLKTKMKIHFFAGTLDNVALKMDERDFLHIFSHVKLDLMIT